MSYIERMQSISFNTYMETSPLGFIMQQALHYISLGLLILTGLAIALITSPHLVTHSVLVPGLSIAQEIRKLPIHYLQPRKVQRGS
jgi:hypothetical protein